MNRSIRRHSLRAVLVLAAMVVGAASVAAQSTGSLQGTIEDTQGAVIPGVTVTITNVGTGLERTVESDSNGIYLAAALPPGRYRVLAHISGFQDQTQETDLDAAGPMVVHFRLGVSGLVEQVSVTGTSPMVETSTISVGHVVTQRTVQEIPLNGRHFVDLGLLIPGSVTPPQAGFLTAPLRGQGSFSFNTAGNREDTVNFMVNGINLNDQVQNQITFQPS